VSKFNIKEVVRPGRMVVFAYYRDGALWYSTEEVTLPDGSTQGNLTFPVPISDIGNATFLAADKAMLFMRYIRKHVDAIDASRAAQNSGETP